MKKIFVSMPMRDLFEDEIARKQGKLLELAGEHLHDAVELIDSYLPEEHFRKPLACLGEAIKRMADADYVVFGEGWRDARGCKIEMACAANYGKKILLEDNGNLEEVG